MPRRVLSLLTLTLLTVVMGCNSGPAKKSTFSATGKVTVDDKPLAGPATLTLSNEDITEGAPSISGAVDKDGNVKFTTYGNDGVVAAGKYKVTLAGDIMSASVLVPATEPATIEIKSGDKEVTISLKAIPGAPPVGGIAMPVSPP